MVYTEYFEEGTEPTEYCDKHYLGTVCTQSHMFANSTCPNYGGVFIVDGAPGSADEPFSVNAATFGQYCPLHPGEPLPNSGQIGGGEVAPEGEGKIEVVGGE